VKGEKEMEEEEEIPPLFLVFLLLSRGDTTKQVASERVYQQMNENPSGKITPAYLQIAVRYIYTHTSECEY
jgi:hypothetical protein